MNNNVGFRVGSFFDFKSFMEEVNMIDKNELCEKIKEIYPDIGECGINVDVTFDDAKGAWIVDLKHGVHELQTHLEPDDAQACLSGKECVHLGTKIGQLKENVDRT
jgi:hypothetical protein